MKKSIIFMCICAFALMLGSCEPKEIENDLAGHSFECNYGYGIGATGLDFSPYSYRVTYWFYLNGDMRSYDNYYTYENKIVKVYLDKECTDLVLTGVFKGDRIIVDGDEDFPYLMRW